MLTLRRDCTGAKELSCPSLQQQLPVLCLSQPPFPSTGALHPKVSSDTESDTNTPCCFLQEVSTTGPSFMCLCMHMQLGKVKKEEEVEVCQQFQGSADPGQLLITCSNESHLPHTISAARNMCFTYK